MKQTVLLVDDDPLVHKVVGKSLEERGFAVLNASSGEEGLKLIRKSMPDLVVLDLGLQDIGGLDVMGVIKNDSQISHLPIIILTGSEQERQDIACLDKGADDYVVKNFDAESFLARVKAVLRRSQFDGDNAGLLKCRDLSIDAGRRVVLLKERLVENLTSKEFDVLYLLVKHSPRVISRELLARKIWKGKLGIVSTRTIDVHIRRIRQKLGEILRANIVTVPGQGYKYREQ